MGLRPHPATGLFPVAAGEELEEAAAAAAAVDAATAMPPSDRSEAAAATHGREELDADSTPKS